MKKLFFLMGFLSSFPGITQIRQLRFDRLSVENGLPENNPTSLLQDKQGYIWCGTQNGLVRFDGYNMKVYKLATADKKELATCIISTLFQDRVENIWTGTFYEGLFRYNRATDDFTRFSHGKEIETKIGKDHVQSIIEDGDGFIWMISQNGTERGHHLDKLDPATGKIVLFDSLETGKLNIPSKSYKKLYRDHNGHVWLGTENGLFLYDNKQEKFAGYFLVTGKKTIISEIYEAPSQPDVLWLSQRSNGRNGLMRFNVKDNVNKIYASSVSDTNSLVNDTVTTILEDHSLNLWIGTANGLSLFDRRTEKFTSFIRHEKNVKRFANTCFNIREGRDGALWILTGEGLLYLSSSKGRLTRYTADEKEPDALPPFATNSLVNSLVDHNGTLWVGSAYYGLFRLKEQRSQFEFIHQTGKDDYPNGTTTSLGRLKNGTYLIATTSGLYESDSLFQRFNLVKLKTKQKGRVVRPFVITIDKTGIAWIGAWGQSLFRYDPESKKITQLEHNAKDSRSLSGIYVRNIFEDTRKNLWIGTFDRGLCRLDRTTGKFQRFPYVVNESNYAKTEKLDDDDVLSIFEDHEGVLWVGTNDGGLNRWDEKTGRFTSYYNKDQGLISITTIYEDRKNRMWVGTYSGGLFLFDRKTGNFRRFTETEGLVYNNVTSIKEDASGKLWISSGRGFSILNPADFSISTLTTSNGFPTSNLGTEARIITDNNDWLMSTFDGIIRFNPNVLKINPVPPEVLIQSLTFTKQERDHSNLHTILLGDQKKIDLAYNENRLSFQYAGIHYTSPKLNHYQYRLEGYDKNWIKAGHERTATYTNLSPGTYTFSVKASNSDGVWNEKGASVGIIIHPPWWATWWFRSAAVIMIFAVFYHIVRWRLHQRFSLRLERSEKEKQLADLRHRTAEQEMFALRAQMNPHFIFNCLNSINGFILHNNREHASEYLTKFSKLVRLILHNSQATLIPLESELEALRLYLELEAVRFDHHFDFQINIEDDLDIAILKVPPLIIQPFAENAILHGLLHKERKGNLQIDVFLGDEELHFRIRDDGIGIKKAMEIKSKSNNIHKSMAMRITAGRIALLQEQNLIHTDVKINDLVLADGSPGGTEVIIKLPVRYD